jgi:hypothetical protein
MMKAIKNMFKGLVSGSIAALLSLLAIGTVLAYSNTAPRLSVPARPNEPLTVNSSPADVLGLMIDSDQTWDSLVAEYKLTSIDLSTEGNITETQRFWLAKKGELARVEIDGVNPITFVRDASAFQQENRHKKIYSQTAILGTFKYDNFSPREWLSNDSSAVYLHPYGKALPTAYYDFLYPTGIAQSLIVNQANGLESIQVMGEETVAGRKTIIISRLPKNHLYWVDSKTGVILRAQYLGETSQWQLQFEAQSISYGVKIPATVFQYSPSKDIGRVSPSEYQNQP